MKLTDIRRRRILVETDIVNTDEIDRYVAGIASDLEDPRAKEWFQTKVKQWIRRSDGLHVPMTDRNRPPELPEWANERIQQDPEHQFHVFIPTPDLTAQLSHLVDYFNGVPDTDEVWAKLPTMGVQKTLVYAERWVQEAVRLHRNADADEGVETALVVGGMRWIRHHNIVTVKRDGAKLNNCLARDIHTAGILTGEKIVYTLRSSRNEPYVACMLGDRGESVAEIKGRGNKAPVGRYVDASKQLLNALRIPPKGLAVSDIDNMSLFYDGDGKRYGYMTELSEVVITDLQNGYEVSKLPSRRGMIYLVARPEQAAAAKFVRQSDDRLVFDKFDGKLGLSLALAAFRQLWPNGAPAPLADKNYGETGLAYDPEKKIYGTPEELTERGVMEFEDGSRVDKLPSHEGMRYLVTHPEHGVIAEILHWIGGKLSFKPIDVQHQEAARRLARQFVNSHFPEGAPPPVEKPRYNGDKVEGPPSEHAQLGLKYDHHWKQYGNDTELNQEAYRGSALGGFRVLATGPAKGDSLYTFVNSDGQTFAVMQVGRMEGYADNRREVFPKVEKLDLIRLDASKTTEADHAYGNIKFDHSDGNILRTFPAILEFLNTGFPAAPRPMLDVYKSNSFNEIRAVAGIFYDNVEHKYKPFNEASRVIHRFRDGMEVRKWREAETTYYSFLKGDQKVYELEQQEDGAHRQITLHDRDESGHRDTPQFGKNLTDKQKADLAKRLIDLFNRSPEFTKRDLDAMASAFPDLNVYVNTQKKWGRAEDVALPIFTSPHGEFRAVSEGGKDRRVFLFQEGRKISSFDAIVTGDSGDGVPQLISCSDLTHDDPQAAGTSGAAHVALFNHFDLPENDPPTAEDYWKDYGRRESGGGYSAWWKLGVFRQPDRSWSLLQNGKAVYEHQGYRLVNFRNRFMIVRPDGALAGEATKSHKDHQGRFVLTKIMGFGPWSSYREVLRVLSGMVEAGGPVFLPVEGRRSDSYHTNYTEHGFEDDGKGRIRDVEEMHPPQTMVEFSNGWSWRRLPFHQEHNKVAKHHDLPGQRYALVDPQGTVRIYLLRDRDNFLHSYKGESNYDNREVDKAGIWVKGESQYPAQGLDPENLKPYWKYFTAFLEKSRTKLSASQYRTLGIYSDSQGRIKSLKDDPLLSQYLAGKITFKDGFELVKEYSHSNEWRLYRPRREGDDEYNYGRRMLEITLTDEGISKIEPQNKEARRNFHKFMPYLKTLVQIFARVVGDEIED